MCRNVGALIAVALVLSACGGNGKGAQPPTSGSISPAAVTLKANATQQFTAYLNGNTYPPIVWSVDGAPETGSITPSGKYSAPPTPGTYTVRFVVADNPSVGGTATVTVSEGVKVHISSPAAIPLMSRRSTIDFDATVDEATNTAVSWTSTGGSIDTSGVFKAPDAPGTYTITAISVEDARKSDSVQVTVVAKPHVRLEIDGKEPVVLLMDTDNAPNTTANMVSLVNKGYYDGIIFHRYEAGFVIQGGDPLTKTLPLDDPSIGSGGPGYTIPFETNPLLHLHYALGMARSQERDSGGSQFYICLADLPSLDGDYVVFGKVTSGFATVDALRRGDKIVKATVEP